MLDQKTEITQALQELLKKSGKDFLSLSNVKKKMGAGLKKSTGIRSSHSPSSVKTLLEPYLGEELEILRGGRSVYLAVRRAPAEWVLGCLSPNAAKGTGALGRLLPIFSKAGLAGVLNGLLREGRITAVLNEKCEVRLSLPKADIVSQDRENQREAFCSAFKELDQGRIFVRICDLRRRLGWKREEFDALLRHLRDEELIQLHSGDVTMMTPQEVEESFVDENGFRMGTVTWHGRD